MGFGSSKQSSQNQSQQSSQSYNQAYPFLQGALGGEVGNVGKGSSAIASLLGLNGPADTSGLDSYLNSANYNFTRDQGIRGITSSNAAKGLLGSGSALKAITDYSSNLASTFLDKYLSNLTGLSNTGIQAGQILASAGSTANSQGTSYGTSSGSSFNASLG